MDKEFITKMERFIHDNRSTPAGSVRPLEHMAHAHYENRKHEIPSPEDWCVPQIMEGLEYLIKEPMSEANEKGTR